MTSHNTLIKGLIETSFIDWPGFMAAVLFTGGCNFRCPFCHNPDLVVNSTSLPTMPFPSVLRRLKARQDWVDRVVITGGEPTIHKTLPRTIEGLKEAGFHLKLDTNGSYPEMVRSLVEQSLVDFVAMDVKGPLAGYGRFCGINTDNANVRETISFLLEGKVPYLFRMTVVPVLHREEDVLRVAESLRGAARFVLQEFRPHNTLDPAFCAIRPYTPEKFESLRRKVDSLMAAQKS
ncbi:MAG: anaerobic ribonucleoside-triphosphate reductase activating protein [Syntrophorhabdales bacterium]|jgi:pyruvate formate lyase activating enzyme